MTARDGGPAFPHESRDNGPGNIKGRPHDGMSLRDWFAGQALAGDMATYTQTCADKYAKDIATRAYFIADAMLKAREGAE